MADNQKFVQAQPFVLAGAGAVIGDTSITLTSFTTIDGTALAMTDFGTKGYFTLEPGSGDQEEPGTFSGVVQNSNGTATLTGVKSQLTISPYTETSGLSKTHPGGVKLVITNTAGFYNDLTSKDNDETISGTWTFTNPNYPQMDASTPLPTTAAQLATKAYVDSVAVSGAPNADLTTKGIVEIATTAEINSGATLGGTGASVVVRPDQLLASNYGLYLPPSGQKDALAGTSGTPSSSNKYVTNDDTSTTSSNGKIPRANSGGQIDLDYISTGLKFGGTGADGALSITSGTTTIDCANAAVVIKNYTSISITETGALAFSNPNTNGTTVS